MSGVLGKFEKQPADVLDYDFDYSDWLTDRTDTIDTVAVTAESGITLDTPTHLNGVVKVYISGGTNGESYKVTCTVTTTGERVKQAEIVIKVKEI